jgi:hypothetical protein
MNSNMGRTAVYTLSCILGALAMPATVLTADTPATSFELLRIQEFSVASGYVDTWSAERSTVTSGYFVILEVAGGEPATGQLPNPVLYVDGEVVERLEFGQRASRVYALLPGGGRFTGDELTIWFGTPALPERVDRSQIARELEAGLERGTVSAFSAASCQAAALADTGEALRPLVAGTRLELLKLVAKLVRDDDGDASLDFLDKFLNAPTYVMSAEMQELVRRARESPSPSYRALSEP